MRDTTTPRRTIAVVATLALAATCWVISPQPAAAAPTGTITTYADAGISGGAGIAAGPDGNLWFTSVNNNRIGRVTPAGVVTTYTDANISGPAAITAGPDGNLWFTSQTNNRIGRITPTGTVTTYTDANISFPVDIAAGPDGNLWFTNFNNNRIGRIVPGSGVITTYADAGNISNPLGITAGPDGALWFVNNGNDRIGRITTTGTFSNFTDGTGNTKKPYGIITGPDGNLWFTSNQNNRVGRVTTAGVFTTFVDAGITGPNEIAAGSDGNLWFTSFGSDKIGRITPTGTITLFSDPGGNTDGPNGITAGPDSHLWFTTYNSSRVGRVEIQAPDTTNPTVTITTPPVGATYDRNQVVNANFACADEAGGSGIATCVGTVANGSPVPTGTIGTRTFTVTATDVAGNQTVLNRTYTVRDVTNPTVTITTPPVGATYDRNQAVNANFACADEAGGSGIATCVGTVANGSPVPTGAIGTRTFTVTATDVAGNQTILNRTYTVTAPGNGLIAFTSDRDSGNYEIYTMNAAGNAQTRRTNNTAVEITPVWSPDGTRIAFASTRDGNYEIYTMNADGTGQTRRTNNSATDNQPAWSPDGTQIAFSSSRDGNTEIYTMNTDGTGQTRRTNNSATDNQPAWSPDGTQIAFSSSRDGNTEIYTMNTDGTGQTRRTNNSAPDNYPAWSPDGTQIAFSSSRDGNTEIYTMNTDGTGQTRRTNNSAIDDSPAWSPDGTQIAFASVRDGNYEIYTMNADGTAPTRRTNNTAYDDFPAWRAGTELVAPTVTITTPPVGATYDRNQVVTASYVCADEDGGSGIATCVGTVNSGSAVPTGTIGTRTFTVTATDVAGNQTVLNRTYTVTAPGNGQIAFSSTRDGNTEIYTMNADGTSPTRRTNNTTLDDYPAWSSNGTQIAFTSDRDGNYEIYTMNADGTGQTRRTNNSTYELFPRWSPDGTQIAFSSDRDGNFEIYTMNADGTGQTRRTNNSGYDSYPNWSPDGTQIAFSSNRDGNYEIYTMNADGTGQTRRTTTTSASEFLPAWSPDGTQIVFTSDRDSGNGEIYTMNADGTGQTRRTNNAAYDSSPTWSPDGTQIAFTSNRDSGNTEIYTMNADGTGQTRRTNNAAYDASPAWRIAVDGTDPTVTITTPPVGATYDRNQVVNANFACADEAGGSGIATCVGTVANGSPVPTGTIGTRTFTVTATDVAGNQTVVNRTYTVRDVTNPTVTITTPPVGATYDRNQAVNANFACADEAGGSGIATCVGTVANGSPVPTGAIGTRTFTVTATDVAGNQTILNRTYSVVDVTDPTVTITTPPVGATYDRNQVVEADFVCSDEAGGSGIDTCVGTVADGTAIATGTLGAHDFTVTATDNAGNTTALTRTYTVVDVTDPTVTITTPPVGATYDRDEVVEADYGCADEIGGSGLATCVGTVAYGDPLDTSTLGAHDITVTATDVAGNSTTVTRTYTVVDATDPTVTITSPVDGATFDRNQVVEADFGCTDEAGGSGLDTCVGTVADGDPIDTSTVGSQDFTVVATDNDGNTTTVTRTYTVRDVTDPTVTITTPPVGAGYDRDQAVEADFACADEAGGSGIATCVGTVADGAAVPTGTLGTRTFTVTATDNAGNQTVLNRTYAVVDATDPSVTITSPVDGATFDRHQVIDADFACTDEVGGSDIDTCVGTVADGQPIDTATLGAHDFTVTATDNAGNTTTVTHGYTVVDVTDPSVTITSPVDGATFDRHQVIDADFACTDEAGGSGIDTCVGTVADGQPIDTATLGAHDFTVTATDNAGNTTTVTHSYTVVDVTDPTVTITTPPAGATYDRDQVVDADYACADEAGGSGIDACTGTVANGDPIDTGTLGAHDFTVTAKDKAGHTTTVTRSYTVRDVTDPTVTITTPPVGATYDRNQVVEADYSCDDEAGGSGIDTCVGTELDGDPIATGTLGAHDFTVTAKDHAGHTTTVTRTYTVVDVTDPTVTITTPPVGATYDRNQVVEADYTCDDEAGGSGIDTCVGTELDGDPIATGTLGAHDFRVTAKDHAGHTTTVTRTYTVVDVTDPSVTLTTPANGATFDRHQVVEADFECSDEAGGSGIDTCVGTVADGQAIATETLGAHDFTVTATDHAGNTTTVTRSYTIVDVTDPSVTITSPANGATFDRHQVVEADFECSDEAGGSGIDTCVGTVADGQPIATGTLGAHDFAVTATDAAGNDTTVTRSYAIVDVTDPSVTITSPANGATFDRHQVVEADFECSDEAGGSGIDTCVGTVADGQPIATGTLGAHDFAVTATDAAGNDTTVTRSYTIVDVTDPSVTITSPANGATFDRHQVVEADFECSDEAGGSGIDTCVGTVADGQPIATGTLGSHDFTVTATDEAGNVKSVTRSYTVVDVTDPSVTITTPPVGAIYDRHQVVNADYGCFDEVGGSGVAFCVGTVAYGAAIDTDDLGPHDFAVTATDAAGNDTTVTRSYTVVDVTDPSVTITSPANGATFDRHQVVEADFSCSDEAGGSGIDTCVGTVADGQAIATETLGAHDFTVTATDHAGNTTTVTRSYSVVDVTDPSVTITSPANGATFDRHQVVEADFECSDEAGGSGIDTCVGTVADGQPIATGTLGAHDFTVTATDHAGNVKSVTRSYTVVDVTDPSVTITSPANGATFDRHQVVEADFSCSDEAGGSGIDTCVGTVADGTAIGTATLGAHDFTVTATDHAGNVKSVTRSYTVRDATDPSVTITTPGVDAVFDRNEVVNADFECSDEAGGSGVDTCVGTVADGQPIATGTLGGHSFTVVGTDEAGNETTVTRSYSVRDVTDPSVTITAPVDGATFVRDAAVEADFTCGDESGGSGVDTCVGDVADGDPVDTSTAGAQTFTVTATDEAGNTTTVSHGYTVLVPTCAGRVVTVDLATGGVPTSGADVILGTPGEDDIRGRGGDDLVCGRGGNDTIVGGRGLDRLYGGGGGDSLTAGPGGGLLDGGTGADRLLGGSVNDTLRGGGGQDDLDGGARNDLLDGGANFDVCHIGIGRDTPISCESRPRS